MKATAERIGNSNKERILIDGEVFLNSVVVGRWNYIAAQALCSEPDKIRFGKCATYESAERWRAAGMAFEAPKIRVLINATPDPKTTKKDICDFMAANPTATRRRIREGMAYSTWLVGEVPAKTHKVIKIERVA